MKESKLFKLDKNGKLKNKYVLLSDIALMGDLSNHKSLIPFYTASGRAKKQDDLSGINLNTLIPKGQINFSDAKIVICTIPMGFMMSIVNDREFKGQIINPLFKNKLTNLIGIKFSFNEFIDIISKDDCNNIKNTLSQSFSIHSIAILTINHELIAYAINNI